MLLRFYNRSKQRIINLLRYLYSLWEVNSQLYYQITRRTYSTLTPYENKKEKPRRRRHFYQFCFAIIFILLVLIFFILNFIVSELLSEKAEITETENIYESIDEKILLNIHNYSIHHIYIDIGCFNGETIEHFIHFIPNSTFYDIITFEPDPDNYQLCKNRLTQKKYMHLNIIIIPKVAWVRNEKIYFRTERGRESRIDINQTNPDSNSIQLDAIDFSSWLARLIKSNNTKLHIKISSPGTEVKLLEKMVSDGTLGLAEKCEVEWTDRENPHLRARRIYVQLMFDSFGFSALYYTRLQDVRKQFQINGTLTNVTKYYDWSQISESDTFAHYIQRPTVSVTNKAKRKINKL